MPTDDGSVYLVDAPHPAVFYGLRVRWHRRTVHSRLRRFLFCHKPTRETDQGNIRFNNRWKPRHPLRQHIRRVLTLHVRSVFRCAYSARAAERHNRGCYQSGQPRRNRLYNKWYGIQQLLSEQWPSVQSSGAEPVATDADTASATTATTTAAAAVSNSAPVIRHKSGLPVHHASRIRGNVIFKNASVWGPS